MIRGSPMDLSDGTEDVLRLCIKPCRQKTFLESLASSLNIERNLTVFLDTSKSHLSKLYQDCDTYLAVKHLLSPQQILRLTRSCIQILINPLNAFYEDFITDLNTTEAP